VLRLHLLLVDLRRPAGKEDAARGGSRHGGDLARLRCRGGEGEKEGQTPVSYVLAIGVEEGEGVAGPYVMLWRYWKAFSDRPPPKELRRLLEQVFLGKGLCLYAC
jgi:hypothetical protein